MLHIYISQYDLYLCETYTHIHKQQPVKHHIEYPNIIDHKLKKILLKIGMYSDVACVIMQYCDNIVKDTSWRYKMLKYIKK